jgi:glycosyltransferase involved in cell wall biosynthesis
MTQYPLHVLHMVQLYHPVPSGASRYFVEIGERIVQEDARHRVTVLTTDAFHLEHLWSRGRRSIADLHDTHNGVQVIRFPIARLPGSPLAYPVIRRFMVEVSRLPLPHRLQVTLLRHMAMMTPWMRGLADYLASAPELATVSLVHTTNITLDFALLPVAAWAKARGIPHICTPFVHLGEPNNRQIVQYYTMPHQIDMLRQSAAVITQTSLERAFLRQRGVPDGRMQTIGVGVSPAELAGGDGKRFRQDQAIADDCPIVLTVGVAAHDKGALHTIQAMQQLWARGSRAVWVQVGPLMSHFESFVRGLPAEDQARMRVLGYSPDQVKRDALAAADVFVLPSRTDSFGIVYLEAWLYGVPVIGAMAGGVPEVITHGTNGLLVPFGAVAELTAAIDRLLCDSTLAQAMGEAGRRHVLRSLTWEQVYTRVRELYDSLVT